MKISVQTPDTLPVLEGNPAIWGRSIRNVLHNALFYAQQAEAAEPEIRLTLKPEAGAVALEIANNGLVIESRHQAKIFDMFFTTKPVGQGKGTGLSLAQMLLSQQGGTTALLDAGRTSG